MLTSGGQITYYYNMFIVLLYSIWVFCVSPMLPCEKDQKTKTETAPSKQNKLSSNS